MESAMIRLRLADEMLNLTSVFLEMNGVSQSVLKKNDENAMNTARKSLNKCLNYLESVVTKTADAPFSTYEKQLEDIASFTPVERYDLVQKIGSVINLFKEAYGYDPKWKGTFL